MLARLPRLSFVPASLSIIAFSTTATSLPGNFDPNLSHSKRDPTASMAAHLLNQKDAQQLDVELMASPGFSIDQLMELAGLSVACAVQKQYPRGGYWAPLNGPAPPGPLPSLARRILIVAGPGNNGGDALVAARHLKHFGYEPDVVYPKPGTRELFANLVAQCRALGIAFLDGAGPDAAAVRATYGVVLDGIFGFSFKPAGGVRAPFDAVLETLRQVDRTAELAAAAGGGAAADQALPYAGAGRPAVVSIDIPSGWDVEAGNTHGVGLEPDALISLTAPKQCAAFFRGHHWLGGRFLPPALAKKYGLDGDALPAYPGAEQCVRITPADLCEAVEAAPANPPPAVGDGGGGGGGGGSAL